MKSGHDQLQDWMKRRELNQREAADHFGWDETFISQLVGGRRRPGLTNAVTIERETGIPVEAWLSSDVDESDGEAVTAGRKRRQDKA